MEVGEGLGEEREGTDSKEDIPRGAAAGEVGDGIIEALEDGAGGVETTELLESFVEDVASIKIGNDEDIGLAGDGGETGIIRWGAGSPFGGFFGGDGGVEGGVELHFAVNVEKWLRLEVWRSGGLR